MKEKNRYIRIIVFITSLILLISAQCFSQKKNDKMTLILIDRTVALKAKGKQRWQNNIINYIDGIQRDAKGTRQYFVKALSIHAYTMSASLVAAEQFSGKTGSKYRNQLKKALTAINKK